MPLSPADYRKTRYTHRRGTAAARPAAADVLAGTLYFSTDTLVLERSTGAAWESYSVSIPVFTAGSVIFAGASGELAQDNTNFFFDDTNNILRVTGAIVGGTGVNDDLHLRATTGVGTTNARIFLEVGNNGVIQAVEVKPDAGGNFGQVGIGTPGIVSVDCPLSIFGTGADIGYLIKAKAAGGNPSAFAQMQSAAGDANAAAGFSFFQAQNSVEWQMANVGNDGDAMRWTVITGGGAVTTIVGYMTKTFNFIIDSTRSDVTTGTKCLVFGDGTAPTAVATNTSAVYANDVGGTVNLFTMNEAAEITQLSGDMQLPSGKLLRLGGSSATEVALKRSTVVLQTRLADDSAFAQFSALEFMNNRANFLMRTAVAWNDGAAAAVGTLNNAPAAGDPTKWIPVDDNGTTRFIPAW
jgi:hypothetical protein